MTASSTRAMADVEITPGPKRAGRYPIAVLAKALDLLDLLDAHESLTLTELSAHAGINKATALRVLANLEDRRYVEREATTGRYRLGFRLLQLGVRKSEGLDLRTVARPILKRLQTEFDETVNLAVPAADGIVYIDILESAHGLRMAASIGRRDDYHSTALGKAIMAHWPEAVRDDFVRRRPLTQKTPHTIVGSSALTDELRRIREGGYAIDDEENELGARCVGAPVFDHWGGVAAAISVSGPGSRLTAERLAEMIASVTAASAQISAQLGFGGAAAGDARPDVATSMEGDTR